MTVDLSVTSQQNTVGAGLDVLTNIENITGSNYSDKLTGNSSSNVLDGGLGNDILVGGDGDDMLFGGAGNDTLTGGAGKDTYVWRSGEQGTAALPAIDHVVGFDKTQDVLDISDLLDHSGSQSTDVLKTYLSIDSTNASNVTIEIHAAPGGSIVEKIVLDGVGFNQFTNNTGTAGATDVLNYLLDTQHHLLNIDK